MFKTNKHSKSSVLSLPLLALVLALSACTKTSDTNEAVSPAPVAPIVTGVSFKTELVPILRQRCATCHLTGEEAGNMTLHPKAAYGSLLGSDGKGRASVGSDHLIVKPGAPDLSYVIMKLENTQVENDGTGARMPFAAPPLDTETIQKFRDWIAAGAPDN